ncbi:MAG: hypothetical protein IKV94_02145 [Clostridia bacterium]|nr:hypothetical protein [Clostridia bacterium]
MNNILNSKLLELLSGVDKNQLEQVSNIVKNMSKDDLNNLTRMLGINNSSIQNPRTNNENG